MNYNQFENYFSDKNDYFENKFDEKEDMMIILLIVHSLNMLISKEVKMLFQIKELFVLMKDI